MSREFLDYYSDNLSFLRKLSSEFAQEFPKIGSRLDLSNLECTDPFVERLLEGTAFLCAKVENKLDDGYPRLLEGVLHAISPNVLSPIPSCGVISVLNYDLVKLKGKSQRVTNKAQFSVLTKKSQHKVIFTSAFDTIINPIHVSNIEFLSHDSNIIRLTDAKTSSALKLTLSVAQGGIFSQLDLDYLDFYLNLNEQEASSLAELIYTNIDGVYLDTGDSSIKLKGLEVDFSICDKSFNSLNQSELSGIKNLSSYMTNPDFFKFIRIKGLGSSLNKVLGSKASLVFTFNRNSENISFKLYDNSILLNCIPIVNLFSRRSNRVDVNGSYQINVNIDNTSPLDFEIYSIESLEFFNSVNKFVFNAYPFYTSKASFDDGSVYRNFFSLNRIKRQVGLNGNKRSPYNKSEVFVSLSGRDVQEHIMDNVQFSANCLCTNCDLPLFIQKKDMFSSTLEGVSSFELVSNITKPRAPYVTRAQNDEFKKLSYILTNLSSLFTSSDDDMLLYLKQIVRAFSLKSGDETSRMVGSLLHVTKEEKIYRYINKGCVYYEKGYNVKLTFCQKKLEGIGVFIFARMIVDVLQSFAPINLPISAEIYSDEQGKICTCKI
jgi:type VI secretion system VasI/ImpG family protein